MSGCTVYTGTNGTPPSRAQKWASAPAISRPSDKPGAVILLDGRVALPTGAKGIAARAGGWAKRTAYAVRNPVLMFVRVPVRHPNEGLFSCRFGRTDDDEALRTSEHATRVLEELACP